MESDALLAVTVIGNDRPGIVAGVTKVLFELGCNLQDATSTILSGHFSMILVVRAPEGVGAAEIERALEPTGRDLDLVTLARPVHEASLDVPAATHMVSVYGADRPGIVFRVAEVLAASGVNITDLSSRVIGTDERPVYALLLEVSCPAGTEIAPALASLRSELGVEVSVHPIEADVL